jgi:uncharacterized protein (DUF1501 family)
MEGPLVWPGQHAGFLGAKHDPWHIKDDPNLPNFKVSAVQTMETRDRLNQRRDLLGKLGSGSVDEQFDRAFGMVAAGAVGSAFDLQAEPMAVRDRYGRHTFGQSLLLARRLVEVGVPVVQVNLGRVQNWDNHSNIFSTLKDRLLPPTDRGLTALLADLDARGLLDETLVAVFGEFGRTPKVNAGAGRDHWGRSFFACFFGGGVVGGAVVGKTDVSAAAPITPPYSPMDLGATIYQALGVDHDVELHDQLKRPVKLNRGVPIAAIYGRS